MIVIIVDGERKDLITVKKGAVEKDLRAAFLKIAATDHQWKTWLSNHTPTFSAYRDLYKIFSTLTPKEKIQEKQEIRVTFSPIAPVETNQGNPGGPESTPPLPRPSAASTLKGNPEGERSWLQKIGVQNIGVQNIDVNSPTHDDEEQSGFDEINLSLSNDKSPEEALKDKTAKINNINANANAKTNAIASASDSDSDLDEYSQKCLENRRQNFENMRKRGFNIVMPEEGVKGPKVRKIRKPKKQKENENQQLEAVPLRRSSRIAVVANANRQEDSGDSRSDSDDFETSEEDNAGGKRSTAAPPQGQSSLSKAPAKPRKKQKKVRRSIGGAITKFTPLKIFTQEVKEIVSKGILNQEQADVETLNKFMARHVMEVTGGIDLKKSDYKQLRIQLEARLKEMDIKQHKEFTVKIVYSLSIHVRNERRKEERKIKEKAKKAAKAALLASASASEASASASEASTSKDVPLDEAEDCDDDLLRKPILNKNSIKFALQSSSKRFSIIQNMSVRDAMATYPYLNKPELVIYDYLTRFSKSNGEAEQNFESAVLAAKIVLDIEFTIENELDKLKVILGMDEHFTSRGDIWPLLQFCDEAIQRAAPLDQIPAAQSPALVILQNDRDVISATVVFDGQPLLTLKDPTAFGAIALLMAPYFIYHLEYPSDYTKQLRILELIFSGEEVGNENIAVKKFMEKIGCAKQMLIPM